MKRTIVWILDGAVALLSILAIVCYFFAPVWTVKLHVPLSGEDMQKMIGSVDGYDLSDAFDEGIEIDAAVNISAPLLFQSLGSNAEKTVQKLIDKNVDSVVEQLSVPLSEVSRKVVQSVAKQVVTEKVNEQVKDYLKNNSGSIFQDEEITQKLEGAGIDDSYISEKTGQIFDAIYDEGADVDKVSDMVVDTVAEAYGKLKESGDQDFVEAELSEADKEAIRNGVAEALDSFADENGGLDPDEIVDRFLLEYLQEKNDKGAAKLSAAPENNETRDELVKEVKTYLVNQIPSEANGLIVWGLRGALALIVLSSAAWIYVLVKLIVKLAKNSEDNTVRLKLPVILGWLPFLLFVLIPAIAFGPIRSLLAKSSPTLSSLSAAFSSIGWVALLCALLCAAISIYFIIVRKSARPEKTEAEEE